MGRRRLVSIIIAGIAAVVVTGTALAYFTTSGSGSGSGSANVTLGAVTIAAATAPSQALLPTGSASGDVKATITNPNTSSTHILSLSLDTTQGTGGFSPNASSCALSFATQTNGGNGWTIAASSPSTIDLTSSLTMGAAAANTCQGQTFTVYLKTP
jgi:hypothetical protein